MCDLFSASGQFRGILPKSGHYFLNKPLKEESLTAVKLKGWKGYNAAFEGEGETK